MLRRLRTKFVIITMTIVTLMLAAIFVVLYVSTAGSMERESVRMMEAIARNPMQTARPDRPRGDMQLPYFSLMPDADGKIIVTGNSSFDLSDEAVKEELLRISQESGQPIGVLKDYKLRYMRQESPMGVQVVFADITNEQATLNNMMKIFALIAGSAFLVLLGLSILLARWAVKPVEQAWLQQKQFVADASHELKTPLTVIMTDGELIGAEGCSDEDRQQLAAGIVSMGTQMRGLVESLLELARLDESAGRITLSTVSISDSVSEAALLFEPVFFEKGMSFEYEIEPGLQLKGDSGKLRQLAEILLDNASKYASPGGETRLSLKKTRRGHCSLEVSNRGDPIAPEDIKQLFKRFYRGDSARSMNHSYGLGLSIAQSISQEHGGKIRAASSDGWNSFTVELPIE